MVSRGKVHFAHMLPGFVILPVNNEETQDNNLSARVAGFITYNIEGQDCEIVTINSFRENIGVGTALIDAVKQAAQAEGCKRLWLVTTNDNMRALRFYQKRGFELVAVHRNALAQSRKLKPEIPLTGTDDIPLRDEIELELRL